MRPPSVQPGRRAANSLATAGTRLRLGATILAAVLAVLGAQNAAASSKGSAVVRFALAELLP